MGKETEIAWTDHTFNPWWGCAKVSAGCAHCYAETFSKRVGLKVWGEAGERRVFGEKHWREPLKWNQAAAAAGVRKRVFCASMADVFENHPIATQERPRLWSLIEATPWLDWQLLTKRPENILGIIPWGKLNAPANVWLGCTAENQEMADKRIPLLLQTPAAVRFVSAEPLLGPLDMAKHLTCERDTDGDGNCPRHPRGCPRLGWLIVGGESGPGARPFDVWWARSLVDQCRTAGVACFVKQFGARPYSSPRDPLGETGYEISLSDRKGGDIEEWPEDLRVRQFPEGRTS